MNMLSSKKMCLTALMLGLAGFVLRWGLYRVGFDGRGLLVSWHPLTLGLVLLTALMLVLAVVWGLGQQKGLCRAPEGRLVALGDGLAALGLLHSLLTAGTLNRGILILGFVTALCLIAAGIFHCRGRQPYFLTYGALCVFLAAYLVNRYRIWSQNPQLLDFLPALLAGIAIMLYAYQMTAGCLSQCSRRSWLVLGGLGAFAGLVGAAGGEMPGFCLGGALWILTGLWSGTREGKADHEDELT